MNCPHFYTVSEEGHICLQWYKDPHRMQVMIRKESVVGASVYDVLYQLNRALEIGSQWRAEVIRNALEIK